MKTLSLKLPQALDAKLAVAARRRGESKSATARQAIEAFIEGGGRSTQASCLDLAGDLAGCVEGPRDLSFSRKHMRGYGK